MVARLRDKDTKTSSMFLYLPVRHLVEQTNILPMALRKKLSGQVIKSPCGFG
jgi:hypothetical protein